ncbi:Oidioi.mRNA.OKI2018_I69.PAR.g9527.t1.cds [Oikopleura dioica]|uniref:Oidioi.mRNA.OKI2018_I69.PAR.g9527.t1.cds n=1 Tax=Oikopleura dioica TaxID=34765 RepID=A0ABN7RTR5_OIKDI|nr:Oidioi.mRNA.OKI2018_I69.PAR.g9527.t1.cds [Oikopleura dioica]
MASRPQGFGLTRELALKTAGKYSDSDESEIIAWFSDLGISSGPDARGMDGFQEWLKDGTILCALINTLAPGTVKKIHNTKTVKLQALRMNKEYENISFFLDGCTKYGLEKSDLFQTVDLYEGCNLPQVQMTVFKLGGMAQKKNFAGPAIGVKVANKNARNFTDEQLRQGQSIIGLQMGTNEGASQAGMNPYGQTRQIYNAREAKDLEKKGYAYGSRFAGSLSTVNSENN